MVTDRDFVNLGLDSLLLKSKYAIDNEDPEHAQVVQTTLAAFQAMECYTLISKFTKAYYKHGYTQMLLEDYQPQYERLGLQKDIMKAENIPASLSAAELNAKTKLVNFNQLINASEYLVALNQKFQRSAQLAMEIMQDIDTSSRYADQVKFSQTEIPGFSQESFVRRAKGIVNLLGAINTYDPLKYRQYSLRDERNSLARQLVDAGFSFNQNLIVAPKNEAIHEYGTLESLGWTPQQVSAVSADLGSICKLMPKLDQALDETEVDPESCNSIKPTCTLLENRYNLRNITHVVKYTTITLCDQYVTMGRAFA